MRQMQTMHPHLGFAVTPATDYPNGPTDVKEAIGYSQYWGGERRHDNCRLESIADTLQTRL